VSAPERPLALADSPALAGLSPRVVRRLEAVAVIKRYQRRAVLFRAGDAPAALHFVLAGRVRVARRVESGSNVLHFEDAGGVLGEIPVFGGGAYPATATAAETVCCAVLAAETVERLLVAEPEFARFALHRIARRARAVIARLDELSDYSVKARVAGYLLARSEQTPRRAIDVGMSQAALADRLGTAREVVVRSLRALCEDGALRREGRARFVVVDERRLRELARPRV
jgi:CRP/FNR family transcriptional regulator, dissimilatory nitrate respiration regulator